MEKAKVIKNGNLNLEPINSGNVPVMLSLPSDEEIEAMIKKSKLTARSGGEWLSLFEGAKWLRDEMRKRGN